MAKSVNMCILLGNLTRDVETKYTNSGKAVATIGLATNERTKKDGEWVDKPEFHTVIAWEKTAEIAAEYLKKGDRVYIQGRIQTRSYEKDGQKRYVTEIVANDLVLLSSGSGSKTSPAEPTRSVAEEDLPF